MCGFSGFIDLSKQGHANSSRIIVASMNDRIAHRGPDDSGIWVDEEVGVALGHRRLSVIDLSPEGHQPMVSCCGRYVITFNGEIYNYQDIRKELEIIGAAPIWRGHSDTEVMLAAIAAWGIAAALKHFVGMFAFAIWDRKERVLHLVRDRLGEKPLYYGWAEGVFLFGSELKALSAHPHWRGEISRDVLTLFLRHKYILAPYSIYKGCYKLQPGTIVSVKKDELEAMGKSSTPLPLASNSYWSAKEVVENGGDNPFKGTETDAIKDLDHILGVAISQQMGADVPLGAFLSGGIDSSTVVALMQLHSSRPVQTFTIGFSEPGYDEAGHAKAVARYLGTEHTELYVTPEHALAVIPKLATLFDEPFSDSSQIPTYLLSELTRKHVTVSLSGDGGDELFGGYDRYAYAQNIWGKISWMMSASQDGGTGAGNMPARWINHGLKWLTPTIKKLVNDVRVEMKLDKLSEALTANSPEIFYSKFCSHWPQPSSIVIGATEPITILSDRNCWANLSDFTKKIMFLDMVSYLPDDILVKLDRTAMGVSLETRVPFLDHRLVEFAWQVPLHMKLRNGQGKWLLRQVLYKYMPQNLIERPKKGFSVPIGSWLRGPLREWAEELLNKNRIRNEGFLDSHLIHRMWLEHLSGKRNWHYYLWDVLMFQSWLEAHGHRHGR